MVKLEIEDLKQLHDDGKDVTFNVVENSLILSDVLVDGNIFGKTTAESVEAYEDYLKERQKKKT